MCSMFHSGISMLKEYQKQVIAESGFKMCSIIAGFHQGGPIVHIHCVLSKLLPIRVENEKSAFEKSIIDRLTSVLTALMTTGPSAVASTAPSVTHFSDIFKEDEDNTEDKDSSNADIDDGIDVTIGINVDLHPEGHDIEAAVQDLAFSTEQADIKAVVQDMEYLTIRDNNAGEDFTAALANVSSSEDSDQSGAATVKCIAHKMYIQLPIGPESTTNSSYHLFLTNGQLEA
ncbi:uncharacterized protein EDB91DRAFT_1080755 [Suillus paluster]|uniref:uncharacterized protein n=1 Tax=Suillus paluster TaxID=48578 RepID=UPI001B8841EB|nr:uncharacterized protein EDB91DRAFT_1080755 [Suillus paluster]KAG1744665.1 hypothetical protein EDB91DRAFT_1080755 [Suillus paluster]